MKEGPCAGIIQTLCFSAHAAADIIVFQKLLIFMTAILAPAEDVMTQVSDFGWKQSFSYVGRPGDNAWSESFFSILKKEIVHWRFYPTRESAHQAIFEYIEVFYNRRRVQKRLGYQSPLTFLNAWQQLHLQSVA